MTVTALGVADFVYEALPGRVVFGVGRRAEISAEVDRLGARRAFLIADGAAAATGDELAGHLADRLVGRWDEVVQHVPSELADRARAAAAGAQADVVVCVGGGSSTGLAKAIALTSRLPVIAVPDHLRRQRADTRSTGSPAIATSRPGATSPCSRRPSSTTPS